MGGALATSPKVVSQYECRPYRNQFHIIVHVWNLDNSTLMTAQCQIKMYVPGQNYLATF